MKKVMVLAAMLAMMMVAAAPAFAESQTSGAATAGGATLRAGDLANQAVQVANNVNTGNVSQDATALNVQANVGAAALLEQVALATGDDSFAFNLAGVEQNVTQNNTATQTNTIAQDGIDQVNNAQLTASQAIAQVR